MQGVGAHLYIIMMCAIFGFHISCGLYIEALCEHFKLNIKIIDDKFNKAKTGADYELIRNLFHDVIDLHVKILEYVTYLG